MLSLGEEDQIRARPATSKRFLLEAKAEDLHCWLAERGHPTYRARQILEWVIRRRAESFSVMSDLPLPLRQELEDEWSIFSTRITFHGNSPDGTDKLLLECHDKRQIECVLMVQDRRHTVCLSTQIGCGMGCVFCASGLTGVERNLTSGEIIEQVLQLRNLLPSGETITHIVVMGMGESLANLDNLIFALDSLCSATLGLGLSQRRVTISTVGLPEKIRKLAALNRQYHLAVSLHAPTEEQRNELVPINERIGLNALLEAADCYFQTTGRQVTYEYVLIHGVNDRLPDAQALARLLRRRKAHVNLIPYNPVDGLPFKRPVPGAVRQFVAVLQNQGVSVTVRKTKGQVINAACGQLRRRVNDDRSLPLLSSLDSSMMLDSARVDENPQAYPRK
jgi:23S rRNA (adenine2503-C2)-methyltransferase